MRRGWKVRVLPEFQSQSFLNMMFKKKPKRVKGRMEIFKDPVVPLLP